MAEIPDGWTEVTPGTGYIPESSITNNVYVQMLTSRVERLENFIGDMDRIMSVYANSLQEICDKYLNLLYIEEPQEHNKNILVVDGFLADLDNLPINTVFNIRASHNFAFQDDDESSKIRLKRGDSWVDLPLKKYDIENPGNLIFLQPDDYINGSLYSVYINSQNIAVITSNDAGAVALQEINETNRSLQQLREDINNLGNSQSITSVSANLATIGDLNVTNLKVTNPITLPNGSTCVTPTAANHPATMGWVLDKIKAEINTYHSTYHVFGVGEPAASQMVEGSIYYKYG
jgi:hypothetical protein